MRIGFSKQSLLRQAPLKGLALVRPHFMVGVGSTKPFTSSRRVPTSMSNELSRRSFTLSDCT